MFGYFWQKWAFFGFRHLVTLYDDAIRRVFLNFTMTTLNKCKNVFIKYKTTFLEFGREKEAEAPEFIQLTQNNQRKN